MNCPCGSETAVIESRPSQDGRSIRRRRECKGPTPHRFTTVELRIETRNALRVKPGFDKRLSAEPLRKRLERDPAFREAAGHAIGGRSLRRLLGGQEQVQLRTADRICVEADVDLNELYPV
jgi:transcriptional regulator NrdR family protein